MFSFSVLFCTYSSFEICVQSLSCYQHYNCTCVYSNFLHFAWATSLLGLQTWSDVVNSLLSVCRWLACPIVTYGYLTGYFIENFTYASLLCFIAHELPGTWYASLYASLDTSVYTLLHASLNTSLYFLYIIYCRLHCVLNCILFLVTSLYALLYALLCVCLHDSSYASSFAYLHTSPDTSLFTSLHT